MLTKSYFPHLGKLTNLFPKLSLNKSTAAYVQPDSQNKTLSYKLEKPFDLYRLDNGPSTDVECSKEDCFEIYKKMKEIRLMENSISNLYKSNEIRGYVHLYSGEEAICVGMKAALKEGDSVITSFRAHGWAHMMGISLLGILAELTGRKTGCTKGKGGSMHMYAKEFFGGNGIVGAQVPLGAGIALKHKYMGEHNVCLSIYGDGAANQGQIFEAFNMAKLWNLPCIFVCENNGYAMGTSVSRGSASPDFYKRGEFIPGIRIDGMDVLGVKEATRFARDHALNKGPIILEMLTYRFTPHSMTDPDNTYRKREEIQEVRKKKDPIATFSHHLIENGIFTEEELKTIEHYIKIELADAEHRALTDPELDIQELYNGIYLQQDSTLRVRGCDNFHYSIGK